MKNIIKKSLVIALVYYATILVGCIKDNCNCPIPKTGKFQFTEIVASNLIYKFPADSLFYTIISSADTIGKNEFGIRFQLDFATAFQKCTTPKFSLINSAFACSCVDDNFTSKDTIKNVILNTLFDFDAKHAAGFDVSEYFKVIYPTYSNNGFTLGEAFPRGYTDFNNQYIPKGTKEIELYLKQTVSESKTVAFELIIEYTNGKTISAKTKAVFLK